MIFLTFIFYLFHCINSEFITNSKYPSCKNCIYYKPDILHNDFTSQFNRCENRPQRLSGAGTRNQH
jgi:hypothetical protein